MAIWLKALGAEVSGYALDPESDSSLFEKTSLREAINDYRGDIRDYEKLQSLINKEQPEIIFHLAAQALVIDGYKNPLETFDVNVQGTATVLEIVRKNDCIKKCICITTDKVYHNNEWIWPYRESDRLGGYDPYSASKAAAELIIDSYRNSFFNNKDYDEHGKSIASVRAGNVIGGGDWSPNRIVPDCLNALMSEETINVRNPYAVRPWQHVLEPLGGYLLLGVKMNEDPVKFNESWNFGPEAENIVNVQVLVDKIIEKFGSGNWKDCSDPNALHEATLLSLDINKAKTALAWKPMLNFDTTIEFTVKWYKSYIEEGAEALCESQIQKYTQLCK
ncbi:UNVERIFIED_CONTAM: hypothetical protein GTU68_057094 [Idotea baltica]|nr:hypothetical protein [Idotea baltica]